MSSYYKVQNGVKYDAALLAAAEWAKAGAGDGRISKSDAATLSALVYDGDVRTPTEDRTVRKLYKEGAFTPAGRDEFERLNRSAAAKLASR